MDGVAQVSALGVGDSLDHVFSGHGAFHNSLVSLVAVDGGGGDVVGVVEGHTLRMIIGSCAALSVDIVNGQVKDVLLIEHLDDVFTLGYADGQRQVCCLFQRIAVGALIGVRIDLAAEGGLVGLGHQSILHIVDIVLHGVVVLVDRPLGVQVVGAVLVHASGIISGEGSALLVFPTSEGVALTRGQTGGAVILNRDLTVVGDIFYHLGLVSAEVAVIGDTDSGSLVAPLGVQRHIAGDLHGTVGIVRLTLAVSRGVPAQEDHVAVFEAVAHDGGLGALGVLLGVGHGAGSASGIGIVGHRVTGAVAHLGVQVIVHGDLGARIEGQTTIDRPAQEAVASIERELILLRRQPVGDGITLADGDLVKLGAILIIHRHRVGGSHPLGVQGDPLRGHGLAGEVVSITGAFLAGVPTGKDITVFTFRSGVMLIVGVARNAGLILYRLGLNGFTTADEHEVIAVAVIEELSAIIEPTILGAILLITGEACHIIAVFFANGDTPRSKVGMIQRIVFAASGFGIVLTGQNFYIVVTSGRSSLLLAVKVFTI